MVAVVEVMDEESNKCKDHVSSRVDETEISENSPDYSEEHSKTTEFLLSLHLLRTHSSEMERDSIYSDGEVTQKCEVDL